MIRNRKFTPKKIVTLLVLVVITALSAYFDKGKKTTTSTGQADSASIYYTKHARCRMGCRFVSESEVQDVISLGRVNYRKSDPDKSPCPVFAKEKKTVDRQTVRVVYAECPKENKIITVIDLDTDHKCDCY